MKLSPFRIVDILAIVALALGWSTLVYPQDCSKAVPIMNHPAEDIGKARLRATQKCEGERMTKGKAHRQSVQTLCAESVDAQKLPKAKRDERYAACLRGHGYTK